MSKKTKILLIIVLNIIIILSEIIFGVISNSFALISDALHNTADVIAIIITYIALVFGMKQPTFKYTFGFLKAEMMAGFVNTMFLFITMSYMIYESIVRFLSPQHIEPLYMVVVGLIALIANSISAYALWTIRISSNETDRHSYDEEDINIKSAYFHMLSDALISLSVVIAGIIIYFFQVYYVDSVLTFLFSVYIITQAYPLFKKSFLSLMDINTTLISKASLDSIITHDKVVLQYHDLHIHKPSSKYNFISFHLVFKDDNTTLKEIKSITSEIKKKLEKENFNHILIQADSDNHSKEHTNWIMKTPKNH